ncbi:MAG: glucose-6-phosphate isomerase [Rickettsiales bacterium]|jgi:glucose-6-phosphate isomerase
MSKATRDQETFQETFFSQSLKNLPDLNSEVLDPYLEKVLKAKEQIKNGKLAQLEIAFREDDLEEIENLAAKINQNSKKILVLGVGGSSLGGKTLCAISGKSNDKIKFLESIDSQTIFNNLSDIELRETLFLVISKSGQTVETTCQTLILIELFKKNKITNFAQNFIFITQNKESSLGKIAQQIESKIYHHPSEIGGRFSYLTIVGLLPAAICGLNIRKIRNGAKTILENFLAKNNNLIDHICAAQLYLFDQKYTSNVVMPYIDSLKDFTDWYRQLWAESLGKNGFGSTPINSMGTIDQHSQLQLYLDGPKDKFFTFITGKKPDNNFDVIDLPNCPTLFGGKNLGEIVKIEQDSTIEVLNQKSVPIRVIEFEKLDEENLSALMMQMFLETIIVAFAKNINPFDQEAVELRKDLARKYLQK